MAHVRCLLRRNLFPRLFQRTFATEVAATPVPTFQAYSPLELERVDTGSELAEKAKKPWTELSKEDKIAVYRASFPYTVEQMTYEESDWKLQVGGIAGLLAVALTVFLVLRKYVKPDTPRTLTPEWIQESREMLKKRRANPITGISSQQ